MAKKKIVYGILFERTEDDEFYNYNAIKYVKGEVKKVLRKVFFDGEWTTREIESFFILDDNGNTLGNYPNMYYTTEEKCVDKIVTKEELIKKCEQILDEKFETIPSEAELLEIYLDSFKNCSISISKNIDGNEDEYDEDMFDLRKEWLLNNPKSMTLSHLQAAWDSAFDMITVCESSDKIKETYDFIISVIETMGTYIVTCNEMNAVDRESYANACDTLAKKLKEASDRSCDVELDKKIAKILNKEFRALFDDAAVKAVIAASYAAEKEPKKEPEKKTAITPYKDLNSILVEDIKLTRKEILTELDKTVIGHDEAKVRLLSAIQANDKLTEKNNINSVLLIGPSGCGKTLLVETLSKIMDKPFSLVNTLSLTPAGYKGEDIENVIALQLLRAAKGDIKKAERGVVFFDEFDKKAATLDNDSNFDKKTIDQLLSFMSGTKCHVQYNNKDTELDTSFITFVLGGSFADMIKTMQEGKHDEKSYKGTTIGFVKEEAKKQTDVDEYDLDYPDDVSNEDLIKIGKVRAEIVNRIPTIIVMKGENRKTLKEMLLHSKVSPLLFEEVRLKDKGAILATLEEFIDPFIESAFQRKQCGRSLKNALLEIVEPINDIVDEYPGRFKYAVLNKDCVSNPRDALLIDHENNRYTSFFIILC